MKRVIIWLCLSQSLLVATSGIVAAQPPMLPPRPGGLQAPGPGLPGPAGVRPPVESGMTALTTVTGKVKQFTGNEEEILDGLTLTTASTTTAVRFSPHLGQSISGAVKPGDQLSVSGYSEVTPEGESIFHLVSLTNGKTTITETPPTPPASLPVPTRTTVSGKVTDFQLDRQGRVNGLWLSNQTLVKVPPHVAGQLVTLAPRQTEVTVEGNVQPLMEGQVRLQKRNVIDASQLTVNGQSYLIR